jgi:hypothetical protein
MDGTITEAMAILLGQLHLSLIVLLFVMLRFFSYINKES